MVRFGSNLHIARTEYTETAGRKYYTMAAALTGRREGAPEAGVWLTSVTNWALVLTYWTMKRLELSTFEILLKNLSN